MLTAAIEAVNIQAGTKSGEGVRAKRCDCVEKTYGRIPRQTYFSALLATPRSRGLYPASNVAVVCDKSEAQGIK